MPEREPLTEAELALVAEGCERWTDHYADYEPEHLVPRLLAEHAERGRRIAELEDHKAMLSTCVDGMKLRVAALEAEVRQAKRDAVLMLRDHAADPEEYALAYDRVRQLERS